jgi:hypothetical protein
MTHMFDMRRRENGIEHRLTKIKHSWTNGQVERMNRTIKEATVKRYRYDRHEQLENHLVDFINAYNYGRRLKTLKGLTPYEFICKIWTTEPERFTANPIQQMPGLNTYAPAISARMICAPSTIARILPNAASRGRYFIPQSGATMMSCAATNGKARRMRAAT